MVAGLGARLLQRHRDGSSTQHHTASRCRKVGSITGFSRLPTSKHLHLCSGCPLVWQQEHCRSVGATHLALRSAQVTPVSQILLPVSCSVRSCESLCASVYM